NELGASLTTGQLFQVSGHSLLAVNRGTFTAKGGAKFLANASADQSDSATVINQGGLFLGNIVQAASQDTFSNSEGTVTRNVTQSGATVNFLNRANSTINGTVSVTASGQANVTNDGPVTAASNAFTVTGGLNANAFSNSAANVHGIAVTGGPNSDVFVSTGDNVTAIAFPGYAGAAM